MASHEKFKNFQKTSRSFKNTFRGFRKLLEGFHCDSREVVKDFRYFQAVSSNQGNSQGLETCIRFSMTSPPSRTALNYLN